MGWKVGWGGMGDDEDMIWVSFFNTGTVLVYYADRKTTGILGRISKPQSPVCLA